MKTFLDFFAFPEEEVKRKIFHQLTLIYIATYWFAPREFVLWAMGVTIILVLITELIRLNIPAVNNLMLFRMGGVHRASEINNISGLPWTLAGSLLTMLFFHDKNIVMVSMLYLSFGDTAAALFGKKHGRTRTWYDKTLEGSLACFIVCVIAGLFFLKPTYAVLGAACATVIEILPWPLNDNFWMPLVSAGLLTFLFSIPLLQSLPF
jgi:dolichol kinase